MRTEAAIQIRYIRILAVWAMSMTFVALLSPSASAQSHTFLRSIGSGSPSGAAGSFNGPGRLAIGPVNHNIVVSDFNNNRVQILSATGAFISAFGGTLFSGPNGIKVDPATENIVVVDFNNDRVGIFSSTGTLIGRFGSPGTGNGQFRSPVDLLVHPVTRDIYVTDDVNGVQVFGANGAFLRKLGPIGNADGQFLGARGMAVDPVSHDLLIVDGGRRVIRFDANGTYQGNFPTVSTGPYGCTDIAIDPATRDIFVSDQVGQRILIFDPNGTFLTAFGMVGSGPGEFNLPRDLAIDPSTLNLVVADYGNNRLQLFAPTSTGPSPIVPQVGLWWNPNESGTGYALDYAHGVLVVTVYSYVVGGAPIWYLASGPVTNNSFTSTLDKYQNGQCISCSYQPATINGNDGQMSITFTSTTTANMTLPGGRSFQIQKQAF